METYLNPEDCAKFTFDEGRALRSWFLKKFSPRTIRFAPHITGYYYVICSPDAEEWHFWSMIICEAFIAGLREDQSIQGQ